MKGTLVAFLSLTLFVTTPVFTQVITDQDPNLQRINVIEHLEEKVPLDLTFTDETGKAVTLGSYFNQKKPVVLTLGYYRCPMLCNMVSNALSKAVTQVDWAPGDKYNLVTVSINHRESPELAAAKKATYVTDMNKPGVETWAFLTGDSTQSQALAEAVGFKYFYEEKSGEYAHPAVVVILAEDGMISRYLYGLDYPARDFRLALLEASEGKIGSTLDKLLLFCYHYDPNANSYTLFAGNVMKIGGALTMLVLGIFLFRLWRPSRTRSESAAGLSAS